MGDTQFFVVKKQIDQYIGHYEEGIWIKSRYPDIILIIPKSSLKKKIDEYVESLIENGYIDEDEIHIRVGASPDHI